MPMITKGAALIAFVLTSAVVSAQTVDEVVEKAIVASGGREALAKVTSRLTTGTMTVSTPGGDVNGALEVLNQAPNKLQTVIKLDLSAIGDLRWDKIEDRLMGLVPHEFKALIVSRAR